MINCYFAPVYPQPATEVSIQEIFEANSQLIILVLKGFFTVINIVDISQVTLAVNDGIKTLV